MARKTKSGQFIISAAEVGTYTVCPESWRLRSIEQLDRLADKESINIGNSLHDSWAKLNAEDIFFRRGINILFLLIANALVIALYLMELQ